ncbi:MAG: hypothetical protein ABDI19_03065 [Armatimonadota bacterium]
MRYGFIAGIAAVAAWLLFVPAGAQNAAPNAVLAEETPRVFTVDPAKLRIHRIRVGGDFQPAGQLEDPYVYAQTMMVRWATTGLYALSYVSLVTTTTNTRADDMVLFGGPPDPGTLGYDMTTPVACISEIDTLLVNAGTTAVTVSITLDIHPWNGAFSATSSPPNVVGASIHTQTASVTLPASSLVLVTWDVKTARGGTPLPTPKATWIKLTAPFGTPTTVGWIISNSTPGNTSFLPGRGYFRTDPTAAGGSVFVFLPHGSFAFAARGTHNFVGRLNLSALADRAKPKDLWDIEFDADGPSDPDGDGVEEGLRRNIIDVTVTNDAGPTPFSSRFVTYINADGRFTLPVDAAISQIKVRRWDNALVATFNRPAAWSNDPCSPTDLGAVTVNFGDVNGDGTIDDSDLLTVLFNFGLSE